MKREAHPVLDFVLTPHADARKIEYETT